MTLRKTLTLICLTLYMAVYAGVCYADVINTALFKTLAPNQRITSLWTITDNAIENNIKPGLFFNELDALAVLANQLRDKDLYWHCQYIKQQYANWLPGETADSIINIEAWVKHCPVPSISLVHQFEKGRLLFNNKHYTEGFEHMLTALDEMKETGKNGFPGFSRYVASLQESFYTFEDSRNAIDYGQLINAQKNIDQYQVKSIYLVGQAYLSLHENDSANTYLEKAFALSAANGYSKLSALAAESIGTQFLTTKTFNRAVPYLISSLVLYASNQPARLKLAYCYLQMGKTDSAGYYFKGVERPAVLAADDDFTALYYKYLAAQYYAAKDFDKACLFIDSLLKITDSVNDVRARTMLSSTQNKFKNEIYLFQQSLHHKQEANRLNVHIIEAVVVLLLLVCSAILLYQKNKFLLEQKRENLQRASLLNMEQDALKKELHFAHQQLDDYIKRVTEKTELAEKVLVELKESQTKQMDTTFQQTFNSLVDTILLTDEDWNEFKRLFTKLYPNFYTNLKNAYPGLTPAETKLLTLLKLNLQNKEIAAMTGISDRSVIKTKYRLKKKLEELNVHEELETFVKNI